MLVVHGIWSYGACHLWAEDSGLPAQAPPRAGRPSRAPRPHPFACDTDAIEGSLAEAPVADVLRKAVTAELTLWLPSTQAGPLASPELVRAADAAALGDRSVKVAAPDRPSAREPRPGREALAPWRVPTLATEPAAARDLLEAMGGQAGHSGEFVPGGSLRYWCAVAALVTDLAARGRVLPTLVMEDGGYAARWRPVLSGGDAQRARELAAAMPPVCRAATAVGEQPSVLLTEALDALMDAAVRWRLASAATDGGKPYSLLPTRHGRKPAKIPLAERWIDALTGPDPQVAALKSEDGPEAAELAASLAAWRDSAQLPMGPVRTCFRLVEPSDEAGPAQDDSDPRQEAAAPGDAGENHVGGSWRVEFALQSTGDPSLVMSAADVWAGASTAGLAVGIKHPEEELLAGLGRAARLFPDLDAELRAAAPEQVTLDTRGAFGFLRETAPLLSAAGFGVLLPSWARKARLGLKLTTRSRNTANSKVKASGLGLEELVDFRYQLAVGAQALDEAELEELARLKVPLVRLRGQWVELDQRQLQAALRFMERSHSGTMRAGDALLAGLHGPDGPDGELAIINVDADGWLGDLLSGQADRRLEPVTAPAGFRGKLRAYQQRGLSWMAFLSGLGLGGILADSMGLGKTVQMLGLLAHEREIAATGDRERRPTLLVCPMSLVGNWQREAEKFTPGLTVYVHHGNERLTGAELTTTLAGADLVITTYGIAVRDQEYLRQIEWRRVACDEAQNIKNSATRQAKAVRALPAVNRIALTGTPVENSLTELWSIMEFANPGLLGPAEKFRKAYAIPVERNGDEQAAAALRRHTGPFILRRLKTDQAIISDLPDKLEMKVWCNLTQEQASLYQATVADMLARIDAAEPGIERRGLVLATMAKLKQVCNHPAHLLGDGSRLPGRSGKLARLEEICDEITAVGDKALCFTQYAEFGAMLQPYLAARLGCEVPFLHGGVPKKRRDTMVASFQESGEPAVFLLSLKAGGTGLNLTAASHVIHVDRWWNPAVEDQATDRAFRIGQRQDVQVRTFVCVGTLEERIDAMIEKKRALAERTVGTGEGWLTELSVDQLRDVIALSPEAVSE